MSQPEETMVNDDPARNEGGLAHDEIARLMSKAREALYNPGETRVKEKTNFASRSLVELAMAAQQRLQGEDQPGDVDPDQMSAPLDPAEAEQAAAAAMAEEAAAQAAAHAEALAQIAEDEVIEEEPEEPAPPVFSEADLMAEYKRGFTAGKDTGYKDGQAAGRAEGQATAAGELEQTIQKFESAALALSKASAVDLSRLQSSLNAVICRLASDRAGVAIDDMPEGLIARIEEMAEQIISKTAHPVIRLHPEDLAAIAPLATQREALKPYKFEADDTLDRSDIMVWADGICLDDEITHRMQPDAEEIPSEEADAVEMLAEEAEAADPVAEKTEAPDTGAPQTDSPKTDEA